MTQSHPPITRTTHTLPFDELSPRDFERLCLWLVEREGYERAELVPQDPDDEPASVLLGAHPGGAKGKKRKQALQMRLPGT